MWRILHHFSSNLLQLRLLDWGWLAMFSQLRAPSLMGLAIVLGATAMQLVAQWLAPLESAMLSQAASTTWLNVATLGRRGVEFLGLQVCASALLLV